MKVEELEFYRAVEDHFARLRGTPFLFTPKDFALLRRWWQEGVPLAAVLAGVGEVVERRRERDGDPVSSLSYCRHAVTRHAKRLAAAAVGAATPTPRVDVATAIQRLQTQVTAAADAWPTASEVRSVLAALVRALSTVPPDGDPAAIDETLVKLEVTTLDSLASALSESDRAAVERRVHEELGDVELEGDVSMRTRRALLLRAVRELVGLPRLEISGSEG